jgi:GNAT superfamily N-acetyltransferase
MDVVTIRSAGSRDIERLIDLLGHGALVEGKEDPAPPEAYAAALAEIQSTPGNDVLVADLDGNAVGMCQLVVFRHIQGGGGLCAEIESMHVHPDFRSRGIGGQLLNAADEAARRAGCYRVQLTSNVVRTDAHRFYARHGFEPSHVGFKRLISPLKPQRGSRPTVSTPGADQAERGTSAR